ncbi:MAG: hypothetical protein F4Y90_10130 [Rhodothermaceae bacterium]|nr:hypothetical protein [Rhodothermaceae bacterium]MYF40684.1 hypothetical protein [Rhodothermaceae bacterium]
MLTRKISPKRRLDELYELRRKGGAGGDGWITEIRDLESQVKLNNEEKRTKYTLIGAILGAIPATVVGIVIEHFLDLI